MSLLTKASLVMTPNAIKSNKVYSIIPSNGNGDLTFTRDTAATQINSLGNVENVLTTIPRLNYDSVGGCPSLLLEPQRTNLVLQSEDFSAANWVLTTATITANTDISPSGVQNADRLTANASFSQIQYVHSGNIGTTYTVSFWIKRISGTGQINIRAVENVNTPITITNQWARYTVTATSTQTVARIGISLITSGDVVAIWGAQLEQGAYATSYIPTTTASVTRNADVFTRNNIYTNGLITSVGGTWFVELNNNIAYIRDAFSTGLFLDTIIGGFFNGFSIKHISSISQTLTIVKVIAGNQSNLFTTLTNTVKIAIKWNGTTADVFVNGVKQVSATAFTTTAMEYLGGNGGDVPKYIKSTMLFPTPLTDTECINLTQ